MRLGAWRVEGKRSFTLGIMYAKDLRVLALFRRIIRSNAMEKVEEDEADVA